MIVRELVSEVTSILEAAKSAATIPEARCEAEAEWIVLSVLEKQKGRQLKRSDLVLSLGDDLGLDKELARRFANERAAGKPLQYILGSVQFFNHRYRIRPGVLIPRPETEVLVSHAIRWLETLKGQPSGIELGIGSGAVSGELLAEFTALSMSASEISDSARDLATENLKTLGVLDRIEISKPTKHLEVLEPFFLRSKVDLIVSNPPYLSPLDEIEKSVLKFEPREALFPESLDPNFFYNRIALQAPFVLNPGGRVFVEVPHERALEIQTMFDELGWQTCLHKDLTQRFRVLEAFQLGFGRHG